MKMIKALGIGLVMAFASAASHATITQIFSPAGVGPGPVTLENFEDASFMPGATYSSTSGTVLALASSFAGGVTPSGVSGLSTTSFPDPITITFASPASSVGMFFGNDDTCCSAGYTAFLDIFDSSGLIGTISVVANMNDFADQFLGFTSDQAVTSVKIRYGTGSDVGLFHYIDDVQFNAAAVVSEPAGLALVGSALLIAGLSRRRKA